MWLVESEWKSEKKKEMDLNCWNACWALEAKLQVGALPVIDKLITSFIGVLFHPSYSFIRPSMGGFNSIHN